MPVAGTKIPRWLRSRHPYCPARPPVRGGRRPGSRPGHVRQGRRVAHERGHHEHPLGPSPRRGPPEGGTGTVLSGYLRPVLPLDGRSPRRRGGVRRVGARRRLGPDRRHRRGAARTAEPRATADPAPRDQGAGGEVSRINPARRPGHRAGSNPPLPRRPCSHPVRYATAIFAPGIPDLLRDSERASSGTGLAIRK
jgi:hypothetical protein